MTRDFLKNLGIEDNAVLDKIIAEHASGINAEKAKLEQAQAEGKRQLEELQFEHALERALSSAKARSSKAVKALLDTEKLSLGKDGSVNGLSEQLDRLRAENGYLFEAEDSQPKFLGASGGTGAAAADNSIRAVMGLAPISE